MSDFRREVLKINKSRVNRIKNSNGVYDAYKWIRKNKWLDIGRPLTEHEFYTIIRSINKLLVNSILNGDDIILPHRMGSIELRKYNAKVSIKNDEIITNLPIDWNRTLQLWEEDEESYKSRLLVRMEEKEIFKVFYNKRIANYNNKAFMKFEVNRYLKRGLTQRIKNKLIDAFKL